MSKNISHALIVNYHISVDYTDIFTWEVYIYNSFPIDGVNQLISHELAVMTMVTFTVKTIYIVA